MCEQCVHVCAMCVYTAAVQALQVCAWVVCVRVHSGAAASQRVHELARGSQRQQPLPAELCLHLCLYLSVHACTRAWGRIPCSTVHARCVCVQRVPAVHTPWAAVPADVSACSCLHACPRGCGPRGAVHTFNAHVQCTRAQRRQAQRTLVQRAHVQSGGCGRRCAGSGAACGPSRGDGGGVPVRGGRCRRSRAPPSGRNGAVRAVGRDAPPSPTSHRRARAPRPV